MTIMVVIKKVEAGKEGRGFPSYYELESLTEQSADTQGQGGGQNLDFVESLELEARIYNGEKTISLMSGDGKTGQPLVKE